MLVRGTQVIKSYWMYIIVLHEHERGKQFMTVNEASPGTLSGGQVSSIMNFNEQHR